MARPERNTVDYFPFMCDEGKKMFYIEKVIFGHLLHMENQPQKPKQLH